MSKGDEQAAGKRVEKQLKTYFEAHANEIAAVYLFGSVARGTEKPGSDVDVGVLFSPPPPRTLLGLPLDMEADLERLLKRPVQVVTLNRASPDLRHRVLRDGRLVLEQDRSERIRFEVQTRNEYFDLLPILRRYRRIGAPQEAEHD